MDTTAEDEDLELEVCAACGADISDEAVAYALPTQEYICLDCAVARGGELDELRERWIRAPDITGLAHAEA